MLNKNLEAERLPLEEERLNRVWRYSELMTDLSIKKSAVSEISIASALPLIFGGTGDIIIEKATISPQSLYAFLNFDSDIDDDEIEILEKNFNSSQIKKSCVLISPFNRGKIEISNWPSDEDHRFDKISEIIDDSEAFHANDGNSLYLYALMCSLDGIYGKNESRFIAKILRKCKFNEDIKEQLDEFIKELCRYEQKIEEVKNSSMPYKDVVSEMERLLQEEENSVKELYEFIKGYVSV